MLLNSCSVRTLCRAQHHNVKQALILTMRLLSSSDRYVNQVINHMVDYKRYATEKGAQPAVKWAWQAPASCSGMEAECLAACGAGFSAQSCPWGSYWGPQNLWGAGIGREGEREGGSEGVRERRRAGGREGVRERERGREGRREGGRKEKDKGGKTRASVVTLHMCGMCVALNRAHLASHLVKGKGGSEGVRKGVREGGRE